MSRSARTVLASAMVALVSVALVLPSGGAAPISPATISELPTQWAYGANISNWVNVSNTTDHYVGTIHSYFGLQVVLNQTNISANDTHVELQRTVALDYQAEYCTPTCTNPSAEINASYTSWQTAVGFANFTTGTVENSLGGSVPALAVLDTSARVQGNLTERFNTGYRNLFNTWKTGNDYLTVQASGDLTIDFSPAFGLIPLNISEPDWSSSSTYTAAGSWAASYAWAKNPIFGANTSGRLSPDGSLTSTGTVTVNGWQGPNVVLNGQQATQTAGLTLGGPFTLRDGILFLPVASDIFQANSGQSWSSYADAVGPASTSAINLGSRLPHLGLLASATTFQPQATSTFPTASSGSNSSIIPALSVAPAQPSATPQTLQAQPENVTDATQQSSCLSEGSCLGQIVPWTNTPAKKSLFGAAVVVVAVAVVAALIAVGVVGRRRQLPPPPPRNNSALYPAAQPQAPAPPVPPGVVGSRPPAPPSPPPANDPLGNLW